MDLRIRNRQKKPRVLNCSCIFKMRHFFKRGNRINIIFLLFFCMNLKFTIPYSKPMFCSCTLKRFYVSLILPQAHELNKNTFPSIRRIAAMFQRSEAPAAERNKGPILEKLKELIKVPEGKGDFPSVKILEISSGTGQHVAHFAKNMSPQIFWQPTEFDTGSFSSICAFIKEYNLKNVAPPVFVDIREDHTKWRPVCREAEKTVTNINPISAFEEASFDYVYNSNLIHISSFDCSEGLFYNSGKLLKKGGCLLTYGPYAQNGVLTPQSNINFDAGLRASNPSWGVRDIQLQLKPLAKQNNLELASIIDMPSNNKLLVWKKL